MQLSTKKIQKGARHLLFLMAAIFVCISLFEDVVIRNPQLLSPPSMIEEKTSTARQAMSELILRWADLQNLKEKYGEDEIALESKRKILKALVVRYQKVHHHKLTIVTSPTGLGYFKPIEKNLIQFGHLNPITEYHLEPEWLDGIGLRIYAVRTDEAFSYSVDSYRQYKKDRKEREVFQAFIKTRARTVAEAKANELQEWILGGLMISNADLKNIMANEQPDQKIVKELEENLKLEIKRYREIREKGITIKSSSKGEWDFTPPQIEKNSMHFWGLRRIADYEVQPNWIEDRGLRIFFARPPRAISFSVDSYRDYQMGTEKKKVFYASQTASGNSISETIATELQRWILDELVRLNADLYEEILSDLKLSEYRKEAEIAMLAQGVERYRSARKKGLTITSSRAGMWYFTPVEHNSIGFHYLRPGSKYQVEPLCIQDLGFFIALINPGDVVVYSVDNFKGYQTRSRPKVAGVRARARSLDETIEILRKVGAFRRQRKSSFFIYSVISPDDFRFQRITAPDSPLANALREEITDQVTQAVSNLGLNDYERKKLLLAGEIVFRGFSTKVAAQEAGLDPTRLKLWFSMLRNFLSDFAPKNETRLLESL